MSRKFTVHDFNEAFPTDDACLDFILSLLYPDGVVCRSCQRVTKHHRLSGRKAYSCQECGTHVYPLAGTIFEKSSTRLKSWFYALYIMASTRCGVSAKQLQRELGVTYKTAWRMFNQIRALMGESTEPFKGEVEVDETFIGGKPRAGEVRTRQQAGWWKDRHKTTVVAAVERGGKVAALVTEGSSKEDVYPFIKSKVLPRSTVYTDDFTTYRALGREGYHHERIAHSERVYVSGNVHTNTVEGFFSLLKNGLRGVNHSVSSKHLQGYIDAYCFRYNHRDEGDAAMYDALTSRLSDVRHGRYGRYNPIG